MHADPLSELLSMFMEGLHQARGADRDDLVKAAAQGHTKAVRDILSKSPDKVRAV